MIETAIKKFRKLDVLLNNAGIHIPGSVLETSVDDWRKIASVDVDGVVFCSRGAVHSATC